ncbi:uncharacterized protein LODBEIA_P10860 [Lodderomyces beijingensis]|uniref:chitinase n=1 Tax=Lodderomyces beijingensis TaxID=1775926 RepID=A0ABP0ZHH4_9ASCO
MRLATLLLLPACVLGANIAAYWGQNAGINQKSLAEYCSSSPTDIILLSFLNNFPNLGLNFANQCSNSFGNGVLHCSQIGKDIKTCQSQGKIILLSLGGESGSYGFSSDSQAQEFATTLWNKFGGGTDSERPFDDAIVDGFDFDIENKKQTGYAALANKLRKYFASSSKKYYLSAAPQCPYPDESVGELMAQVDLDFAFIQFYNNYCSINKQFNWDTWSQYASGKNIKLYLGVPGSSSSAGSGYVDSNTLQNTISNIKSDPHFGGVSVWDISSAPQGFMNQISQALAGSLPAQPSTNTWSATLIPTTLSTVYQTPPKPSHDTPTSTTSTANFWGWLGGLFSSAAPTSVAHQPPTTQLPAPAVTSTSTFDWWGLFGAQTTSTAPSAATAAPAAPAAPVSQVRVTNYVTLTTTVIS